jgi:hypothetical protein
MDLLTVPSLGNHFYTILSGAANATDAASRANASVYRGMRGYLATLDSYEEYALIFFGLRARRAWISASDSKLEGNWVTGPTSSSPGGSLSIMPWSSVEPNGATGENCAVVANYGLEDYPCSAAASVIGFYVIEYECTSPNVYSGNTCLSE